MCRTSETRGRFHGVALRRRGAARTAVSCLAASADRALFVSGIETKVGRVAVVSYMRRFRSAVSPEFCYCRYCWSLRLLRSMHDWRPLELPLGRLWTCTVSAPRHLSPPHFNHAGLHAGRVAMRRPDGLERGAIGEGGRSAAGRLAWESRRLAQEWTCPHWRGGCIPAASVGHARPCARATARSVAVHPRSFGDAHSRGIPVVVAMSGVIIGAGCRHPHPNPNFRNDEIAAGMTRRPLSLCLLRRE
ncbi:hypothetical protein GY45DRAFT_395717 [Cubamyces sp. BRFM 1775]|nr:hypothetical protein GY45DRAFT_395717 [Cubamyces sp. BRFM 1775]